MRDITSKLAWTRRSFQELPSQTTTLHRNAFLIPQRSQATSIRSEQETTQQGVSKPVPALHTSCGPMLFVQSRLLEVAKTPPTATKPLMERLGRESRKILPTQIHRPCAVVCTRIGAHLNRKRKRKKCKERSHSEHKERE